MVRSDSGRAGRQKGTKHHMTRRGEGEKGVFSSSILLVGYTKSRTSSPLLPPPPPPPPSHLFSHRDPAIRPFFRLPALCFACLITGLYCSYSAKRASVLCFSCPTALPRASNYHRGALSQIHCVSSGPPPLLVL